MTLFAETRSKWKLLMYKVLRKFNTLQFFFLLKLLVMSKFLQLYKNLTKKILIHTTAWFVFPVQAYFPKYFTMCVTVFVKCMIHVACLPWSLHFCGTVFWSLLHLQQWYSLSVRYWFWFFFNWIHSWLVKCFFLLIHAELTLMHESIKQNFCWNTT